MDKILNAWQELIDGVISVPVFKEDIPYDEPDRYVLLLRESEADIENKQVFGNDSVVITEIVTKFYINIDGSVAEAIDNEIKALILPSPQSLGLDEQSGIQVVDIQATLGSYEKKYDGVKKSFHKTVRYTHRVIQI